MSRPVRGKLLFSLWKAFPYPRKTFLARFGLRRPGCGHQTGRGDPGGPDHRRARRAQAHGTESRERDRFCRGGLLAGTQCGPWPLHPGPAHQNVVLAGRHPRSHAAHRSQVGCSGLHPVVKDERGCLFPFILRITSGAGSSLPPRRGGNKGR